jgi:hypothetical protein
MVEIPLGENQDSEGGGGEETEAEAPTTLAGLSKMLWGTMRSKPTLVVMLNPSS